MGKPLVIATHLPSQVVSTKSSPKSTRSEDRSEESMEVPVSDAKRRRSDGELGGAATKLKSSLATHTSRSTTTSPLATRKLDGGSKRDPSPTPSSGESEASSSMGGEGSTPKSSGASYSVGEKV